MLLHQPRFQAAAQIVSSCRGSLRLIPLNVQTELQNHLQGATESEQRAPVTGALCSLSTTNEASWLGCQLLSASDLKRRSAEAHVRRTAAQEACQGPRTSFQERLAACCGVRSDSIFICRVYFMHHFIVWVCSGKGQTKKNVPLIPVLDAAVVISSMLLASINEVRVVDIVVLPAGPVKKCLGTDYSRENTQPTACGGRLGA